MVVAKNLIKLLPFRSHYHWKWCWNIVTLFTFNKKQNNITWEPPITGNWFCVTEWGRLSSNAIYFYQKNIIQEEGLLSHTLGYIIYRPNMRNKECGINFDILWYDWNSQYFTLVYSTIYIRSSGSCWVTIQIIIFITWFQYSGE